MAWGGLLSTICKKWMRYFLTRASIKWSTKDKLSSLLESLVLPLIIGCLRPFLLIFTLKWIVKALILIHISKIQFRNTIDSIIMMNNVFQFLFWLNSMLRKKYEYWWCFLSSLTACRCVVCLYAIYEFFFVCMYFLSFAFSKYFSRI